MVAFNEYLRIKINLAVLRFPLFFVFYREQMCDCEVFKKTFEIHTNRKICQIYLPFYVLAIKI